MSLERTVSMKASSIDTHMGSIAIDTEAIAQYAGVVATECFGIVGMAGISMKDGLVKLLKGDSLTRGIHVEIDEENICHSCDYFCITCCR